MVERESWALLLVIFSARNNEIHPVIQRNMVKFSTCSIAA
jgi:hypothetical protein